MSVVVVPYNNSWVTIAQADDYFASKFGCAAWASLSVADKTALLLQSFREIQAQPTFSIAATETAQIVKDVQCEYAWYIYISPNRDRVIAMYSGGVRNYSASKFSERMEPWEFPQPIAAMLHDFLSSSGGGSFTATRDFDQW